ncbi:MAG TPA: prepilin peptidase [Gemmataceae bacterium]|nr:prepilin peptidase [Gemmataceae bacterium]
MIALAFYVILVFLFGISIGSFLNVAIARLPLEKSLIWPNSRCGNCIQPIGWYDNLPIISYLWLWGRCRSCRQHYSIVYLFVELCTGLAFVGLVLLEVVANVHDWPGHTIYSVMLGRFPVSTWIGFAWHAILLSFLIAASVCDLKSREIPLQLTLTGTLVGLIGATLMPWPWPHVPGTGLIVRPSPLPMLINQGIYAWPFWAPLPGWAGEEEWLTGLLTGVCGALMGTFLCRGIGFVFSKGLGKDALGLGDADLMMMAGAFLGWQIVLVGFFLSVFPALLFGIIQWAVRRDNSLPFGPSLSFGVMMTCLAWEPINTALPFLRVVLFDGEILFWVAGLAFGMMFVMSLMFRVVRGKESEEPEEPAS